MYLPLSSDLDDPPSISPKTLAKQLNIGNSVQLEKRIKRELEEQGMHQYLFSLQIVFDKKNKKIKNSVLYLPKPNGN